MIPSQAQFEPPGRIIRVSSVFLANNVLHEFHMEIFAPNSTTRLAGILKKSEGLAAF